MAQPAPAQTPAYLLGPASDLTFCWGPCRPKREDMGNTFWFGISLLVTKPMLAAHPYLIWAISPERVLVPVLKRNNAKLSDNARSHCQSHWSVPFGALAQWLSCFYFSPFLSSKPLQFLSHSSFLPFSAYLTKSGLCRFASPTSTLLLPLKTLEFSFFLMFKWYFPCFRLHPLFLNVNQTEN